MSLHLSVLDLFGHWLSCLFLLQIPGGTVEDSRVLSGIMINKDVVHPKMKRYFLFCRFYCMPFLCAVDSMMIRITV